MSKYTVQQVYDADTAVMKSLGSSDMATVIGNLIDENAFHQMVAENVSAVVNTQDITPIDVGAGLIYGFLWGHELGSRARQNTAEQNVGG